MLHPCFYIEEFQKALILHFPTLCNLRVSTFCRALRFDLNLSRKVLENHIIVLHYTVNMFVIAGVAISPSTVIDIGHIGRASIQVR